MAWLTKEWLPRGHVRAIGVLAVSASACAQIIGADEWTPKEEAAAPASAGLAAVAASGAGGAGGAGGETAAATGSGGSGGSSLSSGGGASASSSASTSSGSSFTCSDGMQNGNETDVDCGGGVCDDCEMCKKCQKAGDCISGCCKGSICTAMLGSCNELGNCMDGCQNGVETDVDCGGANCPACSQGKKCMIVSDCLPPLTCQDNMGNFACE